MSIENEIQSLIKEGTDAANRLHAAIADPFTDWLEAEEARGTSVAAVMFGAINMFGLSMAMAHLDCGGVDRGPRIEKAFDIHIPMLKRAFVDGVVGLIAMRDAEEEKANGRKPS